MPENGFNAPLRYRCYIDHSANVSDNVCAFLFPSKADEANIYN